ncbi:hypothetical protein LO772_03680 [Yinghuangia sp. ASG 101]|uniref:hypothetical protein n=1 Tax=Yinghuangia sp. ASG 101 TaxID=2896848 RepID=UPI001E3D1165|nr:hypothetical protein [Yinghuangia sp. ASG 101]UGQ12733.1 hypothetical protein LO772_03680 [Yinghuangia sp. ASG 101]
MGVAVAAGQALGDPGVAGFGEPADGVGHARGHDRGDHRRRQERNRGAGTFAGRGRGGRGMRWGPRIGRIGRIGRVGRAREARQARQFRHREAGRQYAHPVGAEQPAPAYAFGQIRIAAHQRGFDEPVASELPHQAGDAEQLGVVVRGPRGPGDQERGVGRDGERGRAQPRDRVCGGGERRCQQHRFAVPGGRPGKRRGGVVHQVLVAPRRHGDHAHAVRAEPEQAGDVAAQVPAGCRDGGVRAEQRREGGAVRALVAADHDHRGAGEPAVSH